MLSKYSLYLLMGLFLLAGCKDGRAPRDESHSRSSAESEDNKVEIITIQDAPRQESIAAVGTIRFRRETALGFTTSGKVSTVRYDEGERVKAGVLLASLDVTNVRADINVTRAELERAQSENQRIETLFTQGWVTKARLEESHANYEAAKARVEQAKFASDTAKLYAPSAGIIITRNIDAGQIIGAGDTAIIFGQIDNGFILRVPLTSSQAQIMNVGMPVNISISSIENAIFSAAISEIDGRADEQTGSFFANINLPPDSRFKSGQIGTANFSIISDNKIIAIPATALSGVRASEGVVYVYDDKSKKVSIRNVILGKINDNKIEIMGGLSAGEHIVIRGHEKLKNNMRVKIVGRGLSGPIAPKGVASIS